MTQYSRSSSSTSPTNSRSNLERYKLSSSRKREIEKKRAIWREEQRLEKKHYEYKKKCIAMYNMKQKEKEEEERRRRNRSSRESRRDTPPSVLDASNEETRHRRDSRPRTELLDAWRTIFGSSPSRNDRSERTLNSQGNSRLLEMPFVVLPNLRSIRSLEEALTGNQRQQEDNRRDEPIRRPLPPPQRRTSEPSTSRSSRPLPPRERSQKRESSHDRRGHRSRSRSRHRHPDSRDSNYRRSDQERRSQRSPRRTSSSRDHEQHGGYRRPRSPQERAQRDDGGYSVATLPPSHQHGSAPPWSPYPAAPNLNEWSFPPRRQLHPPYPPIGPPLMPCYHFDTYGQPPMRYPPPEYMARHMPMGVPEFRHRPHFPNRRGPRPPPQQYHGNRFRYPRPNFHRGIQQTPDTTQRIDANPSTTQPQPESGNDNTKNQGTSIK